MEYQLYLAVEGIEHTKTKAKSPQTNGICERFHKTILQEFYQVAFRRKIYTSLDELQEDLDEWLKEYNEQRTHTGKHCFGKTPMETFIAALPLVASKQLGKLDKDEEERKLVNVGETESSSPHLKNFLSCYALKNATKKMREARQLKTKKTLSDQWERTCLSDQILTTTL